MNGEQGRESYDDNRSHDLPRIYEVSGIDTDEESSTSSFIEVDSNSNIIACILISLLVESSCDQSRCIIDLHCSRHQYPSLCNFRSEPLFPERTPITHTQRPEVYESGRSARRLTKVAEVP